MTAQHNTTPHHHHHPKAQLFLNAHELLLQVRTVPLFLEGPTRRMKILKTQEEQSALYQKVRQNAQPLERCQHMVTEGVMVLGAIGFIQRDPFHAVDT